MQDASGGNEGRIVLDGKAFKALASETRISVLKALEERRKTASELSKELSLSVQAVSEHLTQLEQAGLAQRNEEGRKWIYYSLSGTGRALLHPETNKLWVVLGISLLALAFSTMSILFSQSNLASPTSAAGALQNQGQPAYWQAQVSGGNEGTQPSTTVKALPKTGAWGTQNAASGGSLDYASKSIPAEAAVEKSENKALGIGDSITLPNGLKFTLVDVAGLGYTANNAPRVKIIVTGENGSQTELFLSKGESATIAGSAIRVESVFAGVGSRNNTNLTVSWNETTPKPAKIKENHPSMTIGQVIYFNEGTLELRDLINFGQGTNFRFEDTQAKFVVTTTNGTVYATNLGVRETKIIEGLDVNFHNCYALINNDGSYALAGNFTFSYFEGADSANASREEAPLFGATPEPVELPPAPPTEGVSSATPSPAPATGPESTNKEYQTHSGNFPLLETLVITIASSAYLYAAWSLFKREKAKMLASLGVLAAIISLLAFSVW